MADDRNKVLRHVMERLFADGHDAPQTMPMGDNWFSEYRRAFCSLGPRHRIIDRWRYDLGWIVQPEVAAPFLAIETRDG